MPKIVDHDKQRLIVAEAALRIIQESGLEQATVRNIAKETGLSVGSMRHYFSSQVELFAFCMNLYVERIEQRVQEMTFEGPLLEDLKNALLQFLPVNEDRIKEMEVWFAFNSKALVHPELQQLSSEMQKKLYKASRDVVQTLIDSGLARAGIKAELEAEKLYALVDGLAYHQLMQPGRLSPEQLEEIVEQQLGTLCHKSE
ncbi:TetR/AcrR family transcriptional regulator [Paenibacillus sp. HW567]|uniref:TetR/AcrR family transcriptional regulator n=1 Tax=Paenibacillus sp. HW567 TaxID=1034769 RepID=UPI00036FA704|nr:TetR/AcrR family transcriptional regulator [Paenibacillus sp. HW567]